MAAFSETKTPKARLPRFDENPYRILDPTQASADFMDSVQPEVPAIEARRRGKRLIKNASVIAGLGIATLGVNKFAENVLHNTEHTPAHANTPAHIESNR